MSSFDDYVRTNASERARPSKTNYGRDIRFKNMEVKKLPIHKALEKYEIHERLLVKILLLKKFVYPESIHPLSMINSIYIAQACYLLMSLTAPLAPNYDKDIYPSRLPRTFNAGQHSMTLQVHKMYEDLNAKDILDLLTSNGYEYLDYDRLMEVCKDVAKSCASYANRVFQTLDKVEGANGKARKAVRAKVNPIKKGRLSQRQLGAKVSLDRICETLEAGDALISHLCKALKLEIDPNIRSTFHRLVNAVRYRQVGNRMNYAVQEIVVLSQSSINVEVILPELLLDESLRNCLLNGSSHGLDIVECCENDRNTRVLKFLLAATDNYLHREDTDGVLNCQIKELFESRQILTAPDLATDPNPDLDLAPDPNPDLDHERYRDSDLYSQNRNKRSKFGILCCLGC